MKEWNEIFDFVFVGNTVKHYCWFVGIILIGIIFKRLISKLSNRLLFKLFKKYSSDISIEKFIEYLHKPTNLFFLLLFIYTGFLQLNYPDSWQLVSSSEFGLKMVVGKSFLTLFISSIVWICLRLVDVFGFILMTRAEKTQGKIDNQIIPFLIEMLKIVVVSLGVFLVLGTVFNLNVGSLIAGLGIGGLAIALAAKETLENLLGSFTIFLDKPFMIGDLVKVGTTTGVVEKIGFRSTRLRTSEHSLVTVPNKKMVDAELDNLSLRTRQRVLFTLSVKYDNPVDQIKSVVAEIRKLLLNHELCSNDNIVRLSDFGINGIEIMVQYFVNSMDYGKYLEVKEEINFKILEIVKLHNVFFAGPATMA